MGIPVLEHIQRLVSGDIIWAPAIDGGFVLTTRGGDFDAASSARTSRSAIPVHTDAAVTLYLQESFTFLLLTSEAAVALAPPSSTAGLRAPLGARNRVDDERGCVCPGPNFVSRGGDGG